MPKTEVAKKDLPGNGRQRLALEPLISQGESVAVLAYALWEKRGRPEGSPDDDWYRAEQELAANPTQRFTRQ